eukprot:GHRR01027377.1.p1 GENE.GHRR01027377.1~~GHRR01027377.1.p1  ORF type:complete len:158 (+),score=23.48 GHRR01027377.1:233-706(+)
MSTQSLPQSSGRGICSSIPTYQNVRQGPQLRYSRRCACPASSEEPPQLTRDPEASLRQYGQWFGKVFKLPSWIAEAPRVRVRTIARRQMDDLVELAVLNERLSGNSEPWEARSRLELIRARRKNWEHIYNYVTKQDAAATLELIEEANEQVRHCCCS